MSYCDTYEPNESPEAAAQIDFGMLLAAVCPEGDRDFYKFDLEPDRTFELLVIFELPEDLDVRLLDGTGETVLQESSTGDDFELIDGAGLPAGSYLVEVFGSGSSVENDYRLDLSASVNAGD